MIISIRDVWDVAAVNHESHIRSAVAKSWVGLFKIGPPTEILSRARCFFEKHEDEILSSLTRSYTTSIADYETQFPFNTPERGQVNKIFGAVFNYEKFRDAKKGWCAYSLCATSPYVVCPYCHLIPTNTESETPDKKGYRPQLDHFIARSEYPFLSLSLGNLVPCCAICNGPKFKHETNFLVEPHLFPLVNEETLIFRLKPKDGKPWSPLLRAIREPRESYEIEIEHPAGNLAAQNSLKTFQLRSRYQSFVHDAYRIAKVGRNPAWMKTITSILGFAPSLEDELGFSNDSNCTEFKHVPLGKMRLDVYNDSRTW